MVEIVNSRIIHQLTHRTLTAFVSNTLRFQFSALLLRILTTTFNAIRISILVNLSSFLLLLLVEEFFILLLQASATLLLQFILLNGEPSKSIYAFVVFIPSTMATSKPTFHDSLIFFKHWIGFTVVHITDAHCDMNQWPVFVFGPPKRYQRTLNRHAKFVGQPLSHLLNQSLSRGILKLCLSDPHKVIVSVQCRYVKPCPKFSL